MRHTCKHCGNESEDIEDAVKYLGRSPDDRPIFACQVCGFDWSEPAKNACGQIIPRTDNC